MKKRDAIVIAVLMNVGLLIILFVSAITSTNNDKEKQEIAFSPEVVQQVESAQNVLDITKDAASETKSEEMYFGLPQKNEEIAQDTKLEKKEEIIVHKLPALVEEIKQSNTLPKEKLKEIIVKKGDSLEKIAKRNGIKVSDIERINQLSSHMLRIGQILLLPESKDTLASNKPKPIFQSENEYYVVKCGDNPWTIAMKHHMKVEELLRLNNLNKEKAKKLRPGMKLRIR